MTGGAGFVGSHLTDALMMAGHEVSIKWRKIEGNKNANTINDSIYAPLKCEFELDASLSNGNHSYTCFHSDNNVIIVDCLLGCVCLVLVLCSFVYTKNGINASAC